jgi:drug/metabolite transporter, DME family
MTPIARASAPFDGPWMVAAAAVLWGTNGTAQALAPAGAQPLIVGAVRLLVGALALIGLAAWRGQLPRPFDRAAWPLRPTLIAAGSVAAYQLCFFAGVALTGVAVGTIVGIGSAPIAAGLLGFLFRGERPGRRWGAATLLALLGCALLALTGGQIAINPLGILLAVGAGTSYAVYTLVSKEMLARHPAPSVMAITFGLGALLVLPLLFGGNLGWLAEPRGAAVALHLGIITVAIAYMLFARGLHTTTVATAATLTLAEPLTAGALGVLVLGEQLTPPAAAGTGLLLLGLLILTGRGARGRVASDE